MVPVGAAFDFISKSERIPGSVGASRLKHKLPHLLPLCPDRVPDKLGVTKLCRG